MAYEINLSSKTAVITGAGRGIGAAIALKLASAGANIAVVELKEEFTTETVAAVRALGVKAEGYAGDVSNLADMQSLMEKIQSDFGSLDILVNNAGITKDTLLIRMGEDEWDAVLRVNLKGAFNCTKAVARIMMKQRSGRIVNMASIVGLIGNAGQANYSASKGGLIALTKTTAKELAGRGITANAIAPGFIKTKMTEVLPDEVKAKMLELVALKQFGEPNDIANTTLPLFRSRFLHHRAGHRRGRRNGNVIFYNQYSFIIPTKEKNMATTFEKVKDIIVKQLGVKPEEVTEDANFTDDLGADSLDLVEVVMALEEEFEAPVPDEEAEKIKTVGDAVRFIDAKLAEKQQQ